MYRKPSWRPSWISQTPQGCQSGIIQIWNQHIFLIQKTWQNVWCPAAGRYSRTVQYSFGILCTWNSTLCKTRVEGVAFTLHAKYRHGMAIVSTQSNTLLSVPTPTSSYMTPCDTVSHSVLSCWLTSCRHTKLDIELCGVLCAWYTYCRWQGFHTRL
jgi:hypothetical protein